MDLVKRFGWDARQPLRRQSASMRRKSTGHWNGTRLTVNGQLTWPHSFCAGLVRGMQNYHMDANGWSDIGYNFLICPHGTVFEGRGLDTVNAGNGTNEGNRTSHAIQFMAGEGNPFTDGEKRAFRDCISLIAFLLGDGTMDDAAMGHRDHKSTACPGDARYSWIHAGMPVDDPNPIDHNEENDEMLSGYDKSPNDVARSMVRELCDRHWGYGKMTVEDQNWLVGEWAKSGRENMMAKLLDHAKSAKGAGV